MKASRIILLFVVLLCFGFNTKTKVKILPKSEVSINGKSNVNSFKCKYDSRLLENEIEVSATKVNDSQFILDNAKIAIKTNGFDCKHKLITRDMKKVLKADEYDTMMIELKELTVSKSNLITKLNIEIAGVSKKYVIPMTYNQTNKNVKGSLKIHIKDFNLKVPKKGLGMIKVNENVVINFNLFLDY